MDVPTLLAFLHLTSAQKFEFRKAVVTLVKNGQSVESVCRTIPFTTRTVYRWVARFALGGFNNLQDRKRTGRPRKWTPEHAEWICSTVLNKTPQQLQFDFALWTVARIRLAFQLRFKVRISKATVRRILRTAGLSPQRPKRRAVKYSPEAVAAWKAQDFPKIAKRARKLGATIVFADESGLDSRCVYGRTWGRKGETPVVRVSNAKYRFSMLAAIGADGSLHYRLHEGSVTGAVFLKFLEQVTREREGKVIVVADNVSIHKSKLVMGWMAEHEAECEIEFQPTYAPEVNPVELLWAWVKREASQRTSKTKAALKRNLEAVLEIMKASPEKVRAFFRERDCKYILV